jgi:hypothetical protein
MNPQMSNKPKMGVIWNLKLKNKIIKIINLRKKQCGPCGTWS